MNRLLIMACSQTKSADPSTRLSARDRYTGPLWQTLKNTDPQGSLAKVAFLSAQEGFRDAIWPVDRYDRRMTPDLAKTMVAGGIGMRWPIMKPGVAGGMTAASSMASMSAWGDKPFDEVCMVGGHLYLDVMRVFVAQFVAAGFITADARLQEINGQIGFMRRDLRHWLLSNEQAVIAA